MNNDPKNNIAHNEKAGFDYFIEDKFEAGLMLEGWEVKAVKNHSVNIKESYVMMKSNEVFLIGCHITPMTAASSHLIADPVRNRKLLLNRSEIDLMSIKVARAGYTLVPMNLYLEKGKIKLQIGLAKGKKQHDKRAAEKNKDWAIEKARIMRTNPQLS